MSDDIYQALARTALLIELDIFGRGAEHRRIVDGLRATTAAIIADRANLTSMSGQTALVTLYGQLAMLGLQIDLDVPDVDLVAEQPPLHGGKLLAGLLGYADDLLPGGSSRPTGTPDVTFALGDSRAPAGAVRVAGTDWHATVGPGITSDRWRAVHPVGALAAATAAAAEGLRAAMPQIAGHLERPAPTDLRWRTVPGRHINLNLDRYRIDRPVPLGDVDLVSGGAITNAALYTLLRVPTAGTTRARVIEPETLDLNNLNRYALARRSMTSGPKAGFLETYSTDALGIVGVQARLDRESLPLLGPLAQRVLVGVDHIPSRWMVQRAAPGWICVGASSHDFVLVSAHPAGSACAGCTHTRDEPTVDAIPTISFVSMWAGLIQALELVAAASGESPGWTRSTNIWPFGLENPRGIHPVCQDRDPRCPVRCGAPPRLQTAA